MPNVGGSIAGQEILIGSLYYVPTKCDFSFGS